MPRGNNVVPNAHFRKEWDLRVRSWFNQPMRKLRRRNNRIAKAAAIAPRPVAGALRPKVRAQTVKYNAKVREGRGFTLDELKGAGVNRKWARTVGIAVDHRRTNKSVDALQANIQRLKAYKARLVLFPLKSVRGKDGKKHAAAKDGAAPAAQLSTVTQLKSKRVLPLGGKRVPRVKARKITDQEKKDSVYKILRQVRTNTRLEGRRKKAAEQKAKEEAEAKK
eukprot:comp15548_c0_seq1/m.23795 comp15548_c0_seq1/g.23795  ORF comp15548_c0_seq1/g.23795 comp15548_c0_seq1/m.23795 type:complete len:222 (-) comp15548_c0_seq1:109-774(-)